MYVLKVPLQVTLALEHARADVTLEGLDVTNTMYCGQVCFQVALTCKRPAANVALEGLDATNTMYCRQVCLHIFFIHKLPAANLALVPGVRMLRSAAAALSMRRVVVSADR